MPTAKYLLDFVLTDALDDGHEVGLGEPDVAIGLATAVHRSHRLDYID